MPIIAYNMAKMKQMAFSDLLPVPKNCMIYFGAQMKGCLETAAPNGKSAYAVCICNK